MRGAAAACGRGARGDGPRPGRTRPVAFVLAILAFGLLASPLQAEPQRVEVVGAYPIRDAQRGKVKPRDEAIQKALWEGVSRVALELLGEEGDEAGDASEAKAGSGAGTPGQPRPDPTERFRKVFGRDILPYTRSFRIVEDRGERPVLFAEEPGVRSEYLVVVEVLVDVERVRGELTRAGLIESTAGSTVTRTVWIELEGLERYAGYRLVVDGLRRTLSASRVESLEFAPRRQLIQVDCPYGAEEIARRIGRLETAELILDPVEVDAEKARIRVLAQHFEPVPEAAPGAPVTASPDAGSPIRP